VRSLGPIVEIEELFEVHQSNPTLHPPGCSAAEPR
jgi:hypothetical protein